MGHGKNKKTQKVGLGQERKETKEERRLRLEEEAKAREYCFKILPYALGGVVLLVVVFAIYVHSLPPKIPVVKDTSGPAVNVKHDGEFMAAMNAPRKENADGGAEPEDVVVNLDGDDL